MKKWRLIVMAMALMGACSLTAWADQTVTVTAQSDDISQNLDLKAVANVFGECKNLEEFEQKLNSADDRISNLDLNGDGMVDYLRVIETGEGQKHLVVIQAVLATDIFQDVATIQVEKDPQGQTVVQVIGDPYIYGVNYIIEPVYIHVPLIYDYFWGPVHAYWVSPFYWGYWPVWYTPFGCWGCGVYCNWMCGWHHAHYCSFRYPVRPWGDYSRMYGGVRRQDYAARNPSGSFSSRSTAGGRASSSGTAIRNTRDLGSAVGTRGATTGTVGTGTRTSVVGTGSRVGSAGQAGGTRAVSPGSSYSGSRVASTGSTTGSRVGSTGSTVRSVATSGGTRSYTPSTGSTRSYTPSTGSRVASTEGTRSYTPSSGNTRSYTPSSGSTRSYSSGSSYSGGSRGYSTPSYSGSRGGGFSGGGFSGGGSRGGGGFSGGGGGGGRR